MTGNATLVEDLRREASDSNVDEVAQSYHEAAADRIAELEVALNDAYPFVCVFVDRYRRDHDLEKLQERHAEIADRIAVLTGRTRMPSKVLID